MSWPDVKLIPQTNKQYYPFQTNIQGPSSSVDQVLLADQVHQYSIMSRAVLTGAILICRGCGQVNKQRPKGPHYSQICRSLGSGHPLLDSPLFELGLSTRFATVLVTPFEHTARHVRLLKRFHRAKSEPNLVGFEPFLFSIPFSWP